MDADIERALRLARTVLDRLGPDAPDWHVVDAHYHHGQFPRDEPPSGPEVPSPHILVRLGPAPGRPRVGVYYTVVVPEEQAIAATAEQIQDHALEEARGPALPPCPGHRHPLLPRPVDGVARWVCPQDRAHHQEPVLPDAHRPDDAQ